MEQAPPGPPSATPRLYMTPQVGKRREGLNPSLLNFSEKLSKGAKKNPGGMNKPYRTKSDLLLQIKDQDGKKKQELEIPVLVQSVNEAISEIVGPDSDIVSCEFNPAGCEWQMELSPNLHGADDSYLLEVVFFANEVQGQINYVFDTLLVPKGVVDPNPLAPPLKGYREAKQVFELLSLKVRKAIVKHEFPDFPEGCKGRPFREVYQLNARVSFQSKKNVCGMEVPGTATNTALDWFFF